MNTAKINKIAEAASTLASRAANLAVMNALTDAWNSLTDQQKRDFAESVGDISIEGDSARLVDDEWHETIHTTNGSAADTYERAVETALSGIDGGAQYLGETWDGADPEEGVSYRPLYCTQSDFDTARNMYQIALDHMAQLLAAN